MNLIHKLQKASYFFYVLLTTAFGLIVSVAYAGNKIPIEIVELNPKPNYSLTTDAQDFNQLTDSSIAGYPIWVHKKKCRMECENSSSHKGKVEFR